MSEQGKRLNHLRIASPCSVDWDSMYGNERVRFCGRCNLHVYNISEMSEDETLTLITETEGRLCARFYRRSDGTVMTKDCPVGLRAVRARVSRVAGIMFSAFMTFYSNAPVRATSGTYVQGDLLRPVVVNRNVNPDARGVAASLTGIVFDPSGAVIADAAITLLNEETGRQQDTTSGEEGEFRIGRLEAGEYIFTVAQPGFSSFKIRLTLNPREMVRVTVTLDTAAPHEIVPVTEG